MMFRIYFLLLALLLSACKDAPKTDEVLTESSVNAPVTRSVFTVEDSLQLTPQTRAHYRNRVLLIQGISEKKLLDSIYSSVTDILFKYDEASITAALQRRKDDFFESQKKLALAKPGVSAQTWTEFRDMIWKSHENGFLTLLYIHEGYTGGAHGFHAQQYKVLDLRSFKKLQLYDVIRKGDTDWDQVLRKHLKTADPENEIGSMLFAEKIGPVENFYLEDGRIHFVYNPYEIAAYAAGIITIPVELNDIRDRLTPEFKSRMGIR